MSDKIMTRHPAGKQGVNIDKAKYDAVREAILKVIDTHGEIAFGKLPDSVGKHLPDFDGSIGWYTTTVKLDLEARGEIERIPNVSPQHLRRKQ